MGEEKKDKLQAKSKVAIIDDHPLVCEAIARAIDDEPDLEVCGFASNVEDALLLVRQQKIDIILVDLSLGQSSGYVLLDALKRDYPDLPSIVLSMHEEQTHAVRAIRSGARGYLMKKESLETIIKAIRQVLSGRIWLKDDSIRQALEKSKDDQVNAKSIPDLLTQRELEIFEMIGRGMPTDKIAKKLFISKRTVESHRDHIKTKLNAPDVLRLHQIAFRWIQDKI